jgi:hypothetical protein
MNNIINNVKAYNNQWGVFLRGLNSAISKNNTLNNIQSYNNSAEGVYIF